MGETECQSSRYVASWDWLGIKEIREWAEVVNSGQDCRISPTGHDSMVGTALTTEREIEDTWNTRDTGVGNRREDQLSPSSGKRQNTSASS